MFEPRNSLTLIRSNFQGWIFWTQAFYFWRNPVMIPFTAAHLNAANKRLIFSTLLVTLGYILLPQAALSESATEQASPRGESLERLAGASRGDACDPLLPQIVYEFAGAINNTASTVNRATVVQCTNRGTTSAEIQVVLYQYNVTSQYCGNATADPLETVTFESSSVQFYAADVIMGAGSVEQGLGQIRSNITDLICTVQAVDPENIPPNWGFDIPLYRVAD